MVSHNPYFNRWFSAIYFYDNELAIVNSHNPYFNRWFSAMKKSIKELIVLLMSQSLF